MFLIETFFGFIFNFYFRCPLIISEDIHLLVLHMLLILLLLFNSAIENFFLINKLLKTVVRILNNGRPQSGIVRDVLEFFELWPLFMIVPATRYALIWRCLWPEGLDEIRHNFCWSPMISNLVWFALMSLIYQVHCVIVTVISRNLIVSIVNNSSHIHLRDIFSLVIGLVSRKSYCSLPILRFRWICSRLLFRIYWPLSCLRERLVLFWWRRETQI